MGSNFWQQAEQAGQWYLEASITNREYQSEFPDKMSILMDEVILKDPEHFEMWKMVKKYGDDKTSRLSTFLFQRSDFRAKVAAAMLIEHYPMLLQIEPEALDIGTWQTIFNKELGGLPDKEPKSLKDIANKFFIMDEFHLLLEHLRPKVSEMYLVDFDYSAVQARVDEALYGSKLHLLASYEGEGVSVVPVIQEIVKASLAGEAELIIKPDHEHFRSYDRVYSHWRQKGNSFDFANEGNIFHCTIEPQEFGYKVYFEEEASSI